MSRKQAYQQALESSGIPSDIAAKVAKIVDRDDPNKPDLGRSKEDQELINNSLKFINK
ncbi:MAG: hypothetical protein RLZZ29_778 [Cyanobacteriota bacterium]|jgi:hypothetical protein